MYVNEVFMNHIYKLNFVTNPLIKDRHAAFLAYTGIGICVIMPYKVFPILGHVFVDRPRDPRHTKGEGGPLLGNRVHPTSCSEAQACTPKHARASRDLTVKYTIPKHTPL